MRKLVDFERERERESASARAKERKITAKESEGRARRRRSSYANSSALSHPLCRSLDRCFLVRDPPLGKEPFTESQF